MTSLRTSNTAFSRTSISSEGQTWPLVEHPLHRYLQQIVFNGLLFIIIITSYCLHTRELLYRPKSKQDDTRNLYIFFPWKMKK